LIGCENISDGHQERNIAKQFCPALRHQAQILLGLRGIEWVIFGLKTLETGGLQGNLAFCEIWNLSMLDRWHEHRNGDGGFGIRIRFLVFERTRQFAGYSVIRKRV
jgi:hypothetical protein